MVSGPDVRAAVSVLSRGIVARNSTGNEGTTKTLTDHACTNYTNALTFITDETGRETNVQT